MELWIILIIVGLGVLGLAVWKLVIKKYLKNLSEETTSSSGSDDDK